MKNWEKCSNQYYEKLLENAEKFLEKRRLKIHQELLRCRKDAETEFNLRLKEIAFQSIINLRAKFYETKKEMKMKIERIERQSNVEVTRPERKSEPHLKSRLRMQFDAATGVGYCRTNKADIYNKDKEIYTGRNVDDVATLLEARYRLRPSTNAGEVEFSTSSNDCEIETKSQNSERTNEFVESVLDSKFLARSFNDKERLYELSSEETFTLSSTLEVDSDTYGWESIPEKESGFETGKCLVNKHSIEETGLPSDEQPPTPTGKYDTICKGNVDIQIEEGGNLSSDDNSKCSQMDEKSTEVPDTEQMRLYEKEIENFLIYPGLLESTLGEHSVTFCTEIEENCSKVIEMLRDENSLRGNENCTDRQQPEVVESRMCEDTGRVEGAQKMGDDATRVCELTPQGSNNEPTHSGQLQKLSGGEAQLELDASFEVVFPAGRSPRSPSKYGKFKSGRKERKTSLAYGRKGNEVGKPRPTLLLPKRPMFSPSDSEPEDMWLVTPLPSWVEFSPLFTNSASAEATNKIPKQRFVFSSQLRNETKNTQNAKDVTFIDKDRIRSEKVEPVLPSSKVASQTDKTKLRRKSKIPVRSNRAKVINFAVS